MSWYIRLGHCTVTELRGEGKGARTKVQTACQALIDLFGALSKNSQKVNELGLRFSGDSGKFAKERIGGEF